ncbi:MAG: DedA family protein [Kangiellaceae bacterium]
MESLSTYILQFIQANAEWAWVIVFIIAFAESLAVIGIMVPGWLLLVGIGTLIGTDVLPFYPVVLSAYLGAIIGEYLSYVVGLKYHGQILEFKLIKKHQPLIEKAKLFFEKYGALGLFFGRFIGPLRAVLPLVAGIFQMPQSVFNLINVTSGIIWAPLYLIPGILAGAAYHLDEQAGSETIFIVLLIVFVAWHTTRQGKKLLTKAKKDDEAEKSSSRINKLNFILSFTILITAISLVIKSHYFEFLKELFGVLTKVIF